MSSGNDPSIQLKIAMIEHKMRIYDRLFNWKEGKSPLRISRGLCLHLWITASKKSHRSMDRSRHSRIWIARG
jgi:hypothetical protein